MNISTIQKFIQEKRLPWFIESRIKTGKNLYFYLKSRGLHLFRRANKNKPLVITFSCGFHGETGGVFAIASIANLLANKYHIEFITYPFSNYNKLLSSKVLLVNTPNLESDLFICDASCAHSFFQQLKSLNKRIIVSCHGLLSELHGLESEYVKSSLSFADKVHFVSSIQQDSFHLEKGMYVVIPNTTGRIKKTSRTYNAGCVGNLNEKRKNADKSVAIALKSKAECIHLWSIEKDIWNNPRVITHSWEGNKDKIYNSFDILVFMSQLETFGLVVIEAMSAGIPCLLPSIPVFEQFRECPGITIIDSTDDRQASETLDDMLQNKDKLRESIIEHFEKTYSEHAISEKWFKCISNLTGIEYKRE